MFQRLLKKIAEVLQEPVRREIRSFHSDFSRTIYKRRNDQEYENKRKFDNPLHLDRYGYKVYSQNDEDGMIQEIFKRIGTTNKIFVEFGVQDGIESNCHFLLFSGWKGLWIEGNEKHFNTLQAFFTKPISSKQLTTVNAFITKENINDLIKEDGGISGEIDLLSIDIDGNDYWVWEEINCINPRAIIIEYNAKFPPPCEWIMEYNSNHTWDGSDKHGASLKSLELLGNKRGYRLVGTNLSGVNAFFVKKELAEGLFAEPATAENFYRAYGDLYISSGNTLSKEYLGK